MAPASEITEPELANGDSPDYHRRMDRRLIVLETRFDTILPTLATKTDLLELKAELNESIGAVRTQMRDSFCDLRMEMHEFKADIHKWMTATMVTIFVGFASMVIAMLTLLRAG